MFSWILDFFHGSVKNFNHLAKKKDLKFFSLA